MSRKPRDKKLNSKQVAELLHINVEAIPYLRKEDGLPFFREGRFIYYWQREIIRWRNARLANNHRRLCNLKQYFNNIGLVKYCSYEHFRELVCHKLWLEGDDVIWYLNRQRPWKEIKDAVAEIITSHTAQKRPRCKYCARPIYSTVHSGVCYPCKIKLERGEPLPDPSARKRDENDLRG